LGHSVFAIGVRATDVCDLCSIEPHVYTVPPSMAGGAAAAASALSPVSRQRSRHSATKKQSIMTYWLAIWHTAASGL